VTEEPDLEALFSDAIDEISEQMKDEDFGTDYGFQSEWEEEDIDEEELELRATTSLFDSLTDYPGHEENIERFCLPLFMKAGSDYAVEHVVESFKKRPSMSQIYAAYLAKFLDKEEVHSSLVAQLEDPSLYDWQKLWVLAALSQATSSDDAAVKCALDLLRDANRGDALRAVAAIYVGRFGDLARRRRLISIYGDVSNYIQAAIYYSSRSWPSVERSNARAIWGGHGQLHNFLTVAMGRR
jgi:hypothetical protein